MHLSLCPIKGHPLPQNFPNVSVRSASRLARPFRRVPVRGSCVPWGLTCSWRVARARAGALATWEQRLVCTRRVPADFCHRHGPTASHGSALWNCHDAGESGSSACARGGRHGASRVLARPCDDRPPPRSRRVVRRLLPPQCRARSERRGKSHGPPCRAAVTEGNLATGQTPERGFARLASRGVLVPCVVVPEGRAAHLAVSQVRGSVGAVTAGHTLGPETRWCLSGKCPTLKCAP